MYFKKIPFLLLIYLLPIGLNGQFLQRPIEKPLIDTTVSKRKIIKIDEGTEKLMNKANKYAENKNSLKQDLSAQGDEYLKKLGLNTSKTSRRRIKSKVKNKLESKNQFLGIKIQERIGSYGSGTRETIEKVHVVKYLEDEKINPYLQFVYCYDADRAQILYLPVDEAKKYLLCHGPYEKYINKVLIEKGEFNMGGKEGRWEEFDRKYTLVNKAYYKNGFPEESKISYYDEKETIIKEIIPIQFGKMTGTYYSFYESGNLQMTGEIEDGIRIGRWLEYYEFGRNGKLKREWKYGEDKFDESEPILVQEREQQ